MKTLIDLSTEIFDIKGLLHADGVLGEQEEKNGCTYNFNRDIDARCFKNAVARFVRTGAREDAFDVFFCYAEIFKTFGGYKNGIDSLLQLLYQHEATSASLLTKHRDHYSHSAYVFALGLAIFMNNKNMQNAFATHFGKDNLYHNFLKYWGMAALFHDIGYPYEIAFLQVKQYGEKIDNKDMAYRLCMQYSNLNGFVELSDEEVKRCGDLMPKGKKDINSLFTDQILKTFGGISGFEKLDEKIVRDSLEKRIIHAEENMDHGYFSAVLFLKKLLKYNKFKLDQSTMDAVMAMFLHNSFYKYTYKNEIKGEKLYQHLHLKEQPLAYLLMLCDELQCWDRVPYGEISKKQQLAWDMDIEVNNDNISVTYFFDDNATATDKAKIEGLIAEINQKVINTDEIATLTAICKDKHKDKKVYDYLSDSKFIDLCKIAETINTSYMEDCENAGIKGYMQSEFDSLTLEYKLSNVAQAKNYVRHLHKINCFFSDRQLDYPVVNEFTEKELSYLAVDEHIRWVAEKVEMGWKYGRQVAENEETDTNSYKDRKERERKRIHRDIVPFSDLSDNEKKKDTFPINNMVKQLAQYGIKIYRTNTVPDRKWVIAGLGHRNLNRIEGFNEEKVRSEIRTYIRELQEDCEVKAFCGCAEGADLLFAEEALKCGVELTAVLPCRWQEFAAEHHDKGEKLMQVLGQAKDVLIKTDNKSRYVEMNRVLIKECNELIIMWDGKELDFEDAEGNEINRGGTFDTICKAEAAKKRIKYLCKSR